MFDSGVVFGERVVLLRRGGSLPQVPARVLLPGAGVSVRDQAASARWRPAPDNGPGSRGRVRRRGSGGRSLLSDSRAERRELLTPGEPSWPERVRAEWGFPERSASDAGAARRLGVGRRGDVHGGEVLLDWGYWQQRVGFLAEQAPGAELAALLEDRPQLCHAPFGAGVPTGLGSPAARLRLDSMAARQRLINALQGDQYADAAALAVEYPANQEFLAAEVMLALRIPEPVAGTMLSDGFTLITKLPQTLAALRAGRISAEVATVMVGATAAVTDPSAVAEIESIVLPTVSFRSRESVRRSICREVVRLDPAGADERHRTARKDRRISRWGDVDGMAWLKIHAPIQDIAATWEVLTGLAAAARTPGDDRTADERRTDVFTDIFKAILDHGGWDGLFLPEQHGRKAHIGVLIPADILFGAGKAAAVATGGGAAGSGTAGGGAAGGGAAGGGAAGGGAAGTSEDVVRTNGSSGACEVVGSGPVGPAQALAIAMEGVWRRLVCDPLTGTLLDYGTTRYVPPDLLKQFVVTRDQECPMVGCSVPSWRGQIDHAIPFAAGGATAEWNTHPPCVHHHRSKDGGGWKVVINADRSKTWTSPLGRSATKAATRLMRPSVVLANMAEPVVTTPSTVSEGLDIAPF